MLSDLSKYGFINAKIRSKIGNIFTENDLLNFKKDFKYQEVVNILIEKNYINENIISIDNSIENIEYSLFTNLIENLKTILSYIHHKTLKEFTSFILQKHEITNLKNTIRLWYTKDYSLIDYIYKKTIIYPINHEAIFGSDTIDEAISHLENTPYKKILLNYIDEFKKDNSLFLFETALDKYYYEQLFTKLNLLNSRDKKIIKKFFGFEIDIKNFLLMIRFKNYYNLDMPTFIKNLIPAGYKTDQTLFENIYLKDDVTSDLFNIFSGLPDYISKDISQKLSTEVNLKNKMLIINDILNEFMILEIRNTLSNYPFTIGIIIVYFLLKELEINSLNSIINLKYYEII